MQWVMADLIEADEEGHRLSYLANGVQEPQNVIVTGQGYNKALHPLHTGAEDAVFSSESLQKSP